MADRTVIYRLMADATGFKAGMVSARTEGVKTAADLEASGKKSAASFSAVEMAAGGAALVIAGKAVMAAADFEQAMSGVQAATHESAASMDSLRQAAMDAGATTKFSATEAAAGIENLAKAGVSTSDILGGGLTGALDLAAAGNLEVGQAAEIAATALTQFNLAGEDVPHVADLLAAGAGKAQGEVTDLSQALNQAGLVAGQMGLSIEETTGTLSAFASAGLLGSDAGTSLKTMLLRLANPSKEASKAMERFGISAYDAQGNMRPMAEIADQIKTGFRGQSQATRDAALATIFGSDAIRAANVLYSEGADGIEDWTAKVDDAGFAAETAAIKMDNLRGDLEILMGSIETGLIGAGDGSQSSLRGATQAATGLLDVLNEISASDVGGGAFDSLNPANFNSPAAQLGLSNLIKTKNFLFGVDDATKDATQSSEEKANADRAASAATARLSGAVQATAEELKAQADALEDARDAAHKTASGFFNLGDSLDDAKVSLGDWIKQMANQADALNNFTANAQKAANKGLRSGLIAALKEAGPEGALRMKQLANATEAEIDRANGAWSKGQRAINDYVDATVKVPKEKSTTVKVDAGPAFASFRAVDQWMTAIDGKRATTYIDTVRTVTDPKGGAAFSQNAMGDVKDRHNPEIAAGGAWRVWAEPETQGESYIPHANDGRRPRARAILEETASILGARSVEWYAGGGNNQNEQARKERERREEAARRAEEKRQREEEKRQRQLERKRVSDQLKSNLANEAQQADLTVTDAKRRLKSAQDAGRGGGEINELKLALKEAETARAEMQKRAAAELRADQQQAAAELIDIQTKAAEEATAAETKAAEEARAHEASMFEAMVSGQEKAANQLISAAGTQLTAAESVRDSIKESMKQIGAAAISAFQSNPFASQGQQRGLSVSTGSGIGWLDALMNDNAGLAERNGLIGQLSGAGVSGTALSTLLESASNEDISSLIASGRLGEFQSLIAQREALQTSTSNAAGQAMYGTQFAAADAQVGTLTAQVAILTQQLEIITAQRPITVYEAHDALATAAEVARLQAVSGVV